MPLKLFRSTGYSSILMAGETRVAMHPGWLILFTSLWIGFACNLGLWRELGGSVSGGLGQVLMTGAFAAAAGAAALSVLGWRKTLKPAAVLAVLAAALAAGMAWQAAAETMGLSGLPVLSWRGLLHWQVGAIVAGLALPPAIWICKT